MRLKTQLIIDQTGRKLMPVICTGLHKIHQVLCEENCVYKWANIQIQYQMISL